MPALSTIAVGQLVKIRENGVLQDFFVAQHGYPIAGNGRTLLVRFRNHSTRAWNALTTNLNNIYGNSLIHTWLNNEYMLLLDECVREQIAIVGIQNVNNLSNPYTIGPLDVRVFLLSGTELNKAGEYAYFPVLGTALPIAGALQIATSSSGTSASQWTRCPWRSTDSLSRHTTAFNLITTGAITSSTVTSSAGVRPCFALPSTINVNVNGEIVTASPAIPHHIKPLG